MFGRLIWGYTNPGSGDKAGLDSYIKFGVIEDLDFPGEYFVNPSVWVDYVGTHKYELSSSKCYLLSSEAKLRKISLIRKEPDGNYQILESLDVLQDEARSHLGRPLDRLKKQVYEVLSDPRLNCMSNANEVRDALQNSLHSAMWYHYCFVKSKQASSLRRRREMEDNFISMSESQTQAVSQRPDTLDIAPPEDNETENILGHTAADLLTPPAKRRMVEIGGVQRPSLLQERIDEMAIERAPLIESVQVTSSSHSSVTSFMAERATGANLLDTGYLYHGAGSTSKSAFDMTLESLAQAAMYEADAKSSYHKDIEPVPAKAVKEEARPDKPDKAAETDKSAQKKLS